MLDIIARVATGTTTVQDAHELKKAFEGVEVRDIIARVATGTTTVKDARRLRRRMLSSIIQRCMKGASDDRSKTYRQNG